MLESDIKSCPSMTYPILQAGCATAARWFKKLHNDASTYWSKNHFP